MRKRLYIVWLHNKTDHRDDEWIKVRAASRLRARKLGERYWEARRLFNFEVGRAFTMPELKQIHPSVHMLEWGTKPWEDENAGRT
jgi:hypothetical protein